MSNIETVNNIKINLGGTQGPMGITRAEFDALNKGGPAGVYDNLATLQSAENTDKTRIYLTTDNGNWNYWNGSAWVSGGVYQANEIDNFSIDYEYKIAYRPSFSHSGGIGYLNIDRNENIIEVVGEPIYVYVNTLTFLLNVGTKVTFDGARGGGLWIVKDSSGSGYTLKCVLFSEYFDDKKAVFVGVIGSKYVCLSIPYKVNNDWTLNRIKKSISYSYLCNPPILGMTTNLININTTDKIIEAKSGVVASYTGQVIVNKQTVSYSDYSVFYVLLDYTTGDIKLEEYSTNGSNKITSNDILIGVYSTQTKAWLGSNNVSIDGTLENTTNGLIEDALKINCLGDSITYGDRNNGISWADKLKNYINIKNITKYGVNGSTISDYVNENPMCNRYMNMGEADLTIIFGGHNDFSLSVPMGEETSKDTKTFYGALNVLLGGLREKYLINKLLVLTPIRVWEHPHSLWEEPINYYSQNKVGKTLKDYRDAIVNRCQYYCIPYLDLYNEGLYGGTDSTRNAVYVDGLHPNDIGYDILARKVASKILGI
jgi:lysophospholipase L1-like esterase|nr:MAG TPA: GDSL like Lipase Acylhydrolase [Caudoviricetes sp.]